MHCTNLPASHVKCINCVTSSHIFHLQGCAVGFCSASAVASVADRSPPIVPEDASLHWWASLDTTSSHSLPVISFVLCPWKLFPCHKTAGSASWRDASLGACCIFVGLMPLWVFLCCSSSLISSNHWPWKEVSNWYRSASSLTVVLSVSKSLSHISNLCHSLLMHSMRVNMQK